MLVLVFGAVMFSNDAEKLVIGPIERMIDTVKLLADNPLANTQSGTKGGEWALVNTEKDVKSGYETALLEKTLAKVSSLMQVGFGAAGAEIIGPTCKTTTARSTQ